jgi:hypothetical protein
VKPWIPYELEFEQEHTLGFIFPNDKPVDLYIGFIAYPLHTTAETKVLDGQFQYQLDSHEVDLYAFGIEKILSPKEVLLRALRRHDKAFIDYALEQGAQLNDVPALFYAAQNQDIALIKYLLYLGADPNKTTDRGYNALHAVCRRNSLGGEYDEQLDTLTAEVIDVLVEAGTDVNGLTIFGETPLMSIVKVASPISIKHLLYHGADPSIKDEDGNTALDVAQKYQNVQANIDILHSAVERLSK